MPLDNYLTFCITIILSIAVFTLSYFDQVRGEEYRVLLPTSLVNMGLTMLTFTVHGLSPHIGEGARTDLYTLELMHICVFALLCVIFAVKYTGHILGKKILGLMFVMMASVLLILILSSARGPFLLTPVVDQMVADHNPLATRRFLNWLFGTYSGVLMIVVLILAFLYLMKDITNLKIVRRCIVMVSVVFLEWFGLWRFFQSYDADDMPILLCTSLSLLILFLGVRISGTYNTLNMAGIELLANIGSGVIISNQNNICMMVNQSAKIFFPELEDVVPQETKLGSFYARLENCELEENGRFLQVEVTSLKNNELEVGRLMIFRDITKQKLEIRRLENQREKAERENEQRMQFLRQTGHELRTPMNVILGITDIALRNERDEQQKVYLHKIKRFSFNLTQTINSFLDVMRLSHGKIQMHESRYFLRSILYDASYMTMLMLTDKDAQFRIDVDPSLPGEWIGSKEYLMAILINLMNNAVKYTEKGEIVVTITGRDLVKDHMILTIQVADTGIGVRSEDKDRIFEEYERADEAERAKIVGSGIGLATVKSMVEELQGTILLESEWGKGSTFTVEIPQKIASIKRIGEFSMSQDPFEIYEREQKNVMANYGWTDVRILIIDDMEINIEILRTILYRDGIEIDSAQKAEDAITLIKKNKYDLILMDNMLDSIDGVTLLKQIRYVPGYEYVPAVVVSADSLLGQKDYFLKNGFVDFIEKPIKRSRIEQAVLNYISEEKRWKRGDASVGAGDRGKSYELDAAEGGFRNKRLLSIYKKEVSQLLGVIEESLKERNLHLLTVKVHGIKGASRDVGLTYLAEQGQILENDLRENAIPSEDLASRVEAYMELVRSQLMELDKTDNAGKEAGQEKAEAMVDEHPGPVDENPSGDYRDEIYVQRELMEALKGYDYEAADVALKKWLRFADPKRQNVLDRIQEELDMLEYDRAIEILQENA